MGYPKKGKPVRDPFLFQIQFFGKDVFGQQEKTYPVKEIQNYVNREQASSDPGYRHSTAGSSFCNPLDGGDAQDQRGDDL